MFVPCRTGFALKKKWQVLTAMPYRAAADSSQVLQPQQSGRVHETDSPRFLLVVSVRSADT